MSPGEWPRPRVVVSACLGFAAVRYSGELIPDKVVAALKEHVDFVPVCPEVEIGLGVPRPVVRLVRGEEGPRMVQPKTGEDLTERPWRLGAMADALLHAFGFFKKALAPREKAHFLDLLADFREERLPLEAPLALLASWARRFAEPYVEAQALLEPYPRALMHVPGA